MISPQLSVAVVAALVAATSASTCTVAPDGKFTWTCQSNKAIRYEDASTSLCLETVEDCASFCRAKREQCGSFSFNEVTKQCKISRDTVLSHYPSIDEQADADACLCFRRYEQEIDISFGPNGAGTISCNAAVDSCLIHCSAGSACNSDTLRCNGVRVCHLGINGGGAGTNSVLDCTGTEYCDVMIRGGGAGEGANVVGAHANSCGSGCTAGGNCGGCAPGRAYTAPCEACAGEPTTDANGGWTPDAGDSGLHGHGATLQCGAGFAPEGGAASATCNDGEWRTAPFGVCTDQPDDCSGNPTNEANGVWSGSSVHGGTKTLTCNSGYRPASTTTSDSSTCSDGTWTQGPFTSCEAITCAQLAAPANGALIGGNGVGDSQQLVCDASYEPNTASGPTSITCQSSGSWTTSAVATCEYVPSSCATNPSTLTGGAWNGAGNHGDVQNIVCQTGYGLTGVGSSSATCDDGAWTGAPFDTCEPNACTGSPSAVTNGNWVGGSNHGDAQALSCDADYEAKSGSSSATCSLGQWQGAPFAICEKIFSDCTTAFPTSDPNGAWNGNSNHLGSVALTCAPGFNAGAGATSATCDDGVWGTGPFASCVGDCDDTPTIDGFGTWSATTGADGDVSTLACAPGTVVVGGSGSATCDAGTWTGEPFGRCGCDLPASEWLTTEFEPFLDIVGTGFVGASAPDTFVVSFDEHRKYTVQSFTTGAANEIVSTIDYVSSTQQDPAACWDNHKLTMQWGDLVPHCSRDSHSDGGVGFWRYTCKLVVDGTEQLSPIRSQGLTREMHHEIPFQVLFPKQVTATVTGLSAFDGVNLAAAIVFQSVVVDVASLDVDVTIDMFTSVQWPYRLKNPSVGAVVAGLSQESLVLHSAQCADAQLDDATDNSPGDAAACSQVWRWELDTHVSLLCELDGAYQLRFEAECQPSFGAATDCPLILDDQGQAVNDFPVDFTLDSEYFCPQVVEEVDLSASLSVWKARFDTTGVFSVPASNFVLSQTAYFQAVASSAKVTIASTSVRKIELVNDCAGGATQTVYNSGLADPWASAVLSPPNAEVWDSSHASVTAANEAHFRLVVLDPPFPAPTDGSCDFAVSVTLDVTFLNNNLMSQSLLLQATGAASQSQPVDAATSFAMRAGDAAGDETTSGAMRVRVVAAGFVGAGVVGVMSA